MRMAVLERISFSIDERDTARVKKRQKIFFCVSRECLHIRQKLHLPCYFLIKNRANRELLLDKTPNGHRIHRSERARALDKVILVRQERGEKDGGKEWCAFPFEDKLEKTKHRRCHAKVQCATMSRQFDLGYLICPVCHARKSNWPYSTTNPMSTKRSRHSSEVSYTSFFSAPRAACLTVCSRCRLDGAIEALGGWTEMTSDRGNVSRRHVVSSFDSRIFHFRAQPNERATNRSIAIAKPHRLPFCRPTVS